MLVNQPYGKQGRSEKYNCFRLAIENFYLRFLSWRTTV